jgi:uncharacterized protein YjdB
MRRFTNPASMFALIAACTIAYAGCAKGIVVGDDALVAAVVVTPPSATIFVNGNTQLSATTVDESGVVLTGRTITWETSASNVATVDDAGLVHGVAAGQAIITARSGDRAGTSVITVQIPPVASVAVNPPSSTIAVNGTVQLSATLRDANGAQLSGRTVTWQTSAAGIATVDGSGLVRGVAAGQATITATSEGKTGTATITVQLPPVASVTVTPASPSIGVSQTVQMVATLRDANGAELTGRAVTWETSAGGIATVSASGLVTGVAAGQAVITARSEGQAGSTTVTVQATPPAPVATVTVSPSAPTILVNGTVQMSATMKDASGNVLSGRAVTWATSASGTATVSASGLVTGVAAGSATITATSEGKSGSTTVTVQIPPVATVAVTPSAPSIAINATVQLSATLKDASGNVLTGRTITWSTAASSIATVNGSGLVTGVTAGQVTITATSEGKTGSSVVTVQAAAPAPVATVTVSPSAPTVAINATQQLTATTKDANGAVLTGRTVTWQSSATGVATVDGAGLVRGVAAGTATITATSEGKSGTATVTVPSAPPPPPTNGVADPTLLPAATRQPAPTGAFGRSLTSGQQYIDPISNLPVLKVTDASTPAANTRAHHDYSEGGPYISQPWQGTDGNTYYTLMVAVEPNRYLVDLRYDNLSLSNWRVIDLDGDLSFSFSLDPSTPRIAYVELSSLSNVVQRYNTATNRVENTGNWPWRPGAGAINWLQNNLNDQWFVAMGSNTTIVAFRPSDGLKRSWSGIAGLDEPHIDREQPYVYIASGNANLVGDLANGGALMAPPGDPNWSYQPNSLQNSAHVNPLRGLLVGVANSQNQAYWRYSVLANKTTSFANVNAVDGFPGEYHQAGQWVFNNGNAADAQWFAIDPSGSDYSSAAIRSGMIGLVKTDGSPARLLAVHNSTGGGNYQTQPHVTFAPDGKLVMWTSDSHGSRTDVYVIRVPVR